jgi:hypothetical protein
MPGNPFDPINRIIRAAVTLKELLHKIEAEVAWMRQNRSAANEVATTDQLGEFEAKHEEWRQRKSIADGNADTRRTMMDLAKKGLITKDTIAPTLKAKIDAYLKQHDLGHFEDALYVIVDRQPINESEVDSQIEYWGTYINRALETYAFIPGNEPVMPIHKNATLNKEFADREAAFEKNFDEESLEQAMTEFNAAARAWPQTANEDYEPFQNLYLDFANAPMEPAIEFIEMIESKARDAKAALKSPPIATPAPPQAQTPKATEYERDAFLSHKLAIQQNPQLATKTQQDVYDWIKENGVEIEGQQYILPVFSTWSSYLRAANRKAQSGNK